MAQPINGIYINHTTKELFVLQSLNNYPYKAVTSKGMARIMIAEGFEYLCYCTGIAQLEFNAKSYKLVNHATYTKSVATQLAELRVLVREEKVLHE